MFFSEDRSNFLVWPLASINSLHQTGQSCTVKYGDFPHQSLVLEGVLAQAVQSEYAAKNLSRAGLMLKSNNSARLAFILIIIFIGLMFGGWFIFLPWVAEKAAGSIPRNMEIALGERLAAAYSNKEDKEDDLASPLLQAFTDQLQLSSDYTITTEVIASDDLNAFALPGGRIFVYSGIIKAMHSYEELVALLGHEVTHVEHRHSLKSICRSAASSLVIAAVFGDVTGVSAGIVSQADKFKELDYSRDLETDADTYGLQLMTKNQISGRGMLNLLQLLKREGQSMPELMKYLSTHPNTEARITNIVGQEGLQRKYPLNPALDDLFKKLQKVLPEG